MTEFVSVAKFSTDSGLAECSIREYIKMGMPVYPSPKGGKLKLRSSECYDWMAKHIRRSCARSPIYQNTLKKIKADQKSRKREDSKSAANAT